MSLYIRKARSFTLQKPLMPRLPNVYPAHQAMSQLILVIRIFRFLSTHKNQQQGLRTHYCCQSTDRYSTGPSLLSQNVFIVDPLMCDVLIENTTSTYVSKTETRSSLFFVLVSRHLCVFLTCPCHKLGQILFFRFRNGFGL
jgi:hypothetical protein